MAECADKSQDMSNKSDEESFTSSDLEDYSDGSEQSDRGEVLMGAQPYSYEPEYTAEELQSQADSEQPSQEHPPPNNRQTDQSW